MKKPPENNHLKIGELPVLRMVNIRDLIFHEDPDEERLLGLVSRLGTERALKNPPIAAEAGSESRPVILDGANRVTALMKLGFEHIPVQVIPLEDPNLTLRCWHHAVEKLDREFFLKELFNISQIETHHEGSAASNADNHMQIAAIYENKGKKVHDAFVCALTFDDGELYTVRHQGSLISQLEKLKAVTDLYLQTSLADRVSYTNTAHLRHNYPEFRTLVTFRTFEKAEIMEIVLSGRKLPAGVTRVILPKRALGLNIPLEFLKSSLTLQEKNHWLEEMIHKLVLGKSIRFYQEPTFVFDE